MRRTFFARLYLWATYRLYDEFAWAYDAVSWLVSFGRWDSRRRQALEHVQGSRVLEVGFGTGELFGELIARGYSAIGMDKSMPMHRIAKSKIEKRGCTPSTVLGKTQNIPFPEESFDCIISTFPAEFITDRQTFLEFNRVLAGRKCNDKVRPGKLIIVGAYFPYTGGMLQSIIQYLFGKPEVPADEYFRELAGETGFLFTMKEPKADKISLPVMIFEKIHQG